MTTDEISDEVANELGWFHRIQKSPIDGRMLDMWEPPGEMKLVAKHPDFVNDLNSCREFEETLDDLPIDFRSAYWDFLFLVVIHGDLNKFIDPFEREWAVLRSTARQRCEAFLRVKGKWKE